MKPTLKEFLSKKEKNNILFADATFGEALKKIDSLNEGITFIVDEKNKLTGVLTDGDIRRFLNKNNGERPDSISDIFTRRPVTINIGTPFDFVLSIMKKRMINALAVVDDENTYMGFITLHETLKYFSPERIYPGETEDKDGNIERHISRYRFASNFVQKDWNVLDCACGSGYGSEILAGQANHVTGVDRSKEAILYAEDNHSPENTHYILEDIENLSFDSEAFDAIISFETIEHIPFEACRMFLLKMVKWLKPGGVFIISSPMLRYRDNEPYITNPYHVNEIDKLSLLEMFNDIFSGFIIHYYHQKQDVFLPLSDEHTGFMVAVGRKKTES